MPNSQTLSKMCNHFCGGFDKNEIFTKFLALGFVPRKHLFYIYNGLKFTLRMEKREMGESWEQIPSPFFGRCLLRKCGCMGLPVPALEFGHLFLLLPFKNFLMFSCVSGSLTWKLWSCRGFPSWVRNLGGRHSSPLGCCCTGLDKVPTQYLPTQQILDGVFRWGCIWILSSWMWSDDTELRWEL